MNMYGVKVNYVGYQDIVKDGSGMNTDVEEWLGRIEEGASVEKGGRKGTRKPESQMLPYSQYNAMALAHWPQHSDLTSGQQSDSGGQGPNTVGRPEVSFGFISQSFASHFTLVFRWGDKVSSEYT